MGERRKLFSNFVAQRGWGEPSHGALSIFPDTMPSQYRHQIARLECAFCDFSIDPAEFRRTDMTREPHPQPYGNMASVAHARKLMRDHLAAAHSEEWAAIKEATHA